MLNYTFFIYSYTVKSNFQAKLISPAMSQPSLVLLQLLLVVGRMTVGAKDVGQFDLEAKKFSCCAEEMNPWEPVCLEKHLVKCAEGQSCRIKMGVPPSNPATIPTAAAHKRKIRQTEKGNPKECVPQTTTQLRCEKDGTDVFCFCGLGDNLFSNCNPNTFLHELRYKICPMPTGQTSQPNCTDPSKESADPYCHYDVTQTATGELQFVLMNKFCSHSTYDLAEIQERKWPPVCTKGEKPDTFECKCVGADCIRHKLEAVLKPPGTSDAGLNEGQIVGIVIGSIAIVAVFCAALIYLRRKPKSSEIVASPPPPVDEEKMAEGAEAEETAEIQEEVENETEGESEEENQAEVEGESQEKNE